MGLMVTLTTKSVRGLLGYEIVRNRILKATKYIYVVLLKVVVHTLLNEINYIANCQQ